MRKGGAAATGRLISVNEAATRLGLSLWTVRAWAYAGKIASCKLGARLLIPESEIPRIIADTIRPVTEGRHAE